MTPHANAEAVAPVAGGLQPVETLVCGQLFDDGDGVMACSGWPKKPSGNAAGSKMSMDAASVAAFKHFYPRPRAGLTVERG